MLEGETAGVIAHVPGAGLAQLTRLLAMGVGCRPSDGAGGGRGVCYDGGEVTSQAGKSEHRHDFPSEGSLTFAGTMEEQ